MKYNTSYIVNITQVYHTVLLFVALNTSDRINAHALTSAVTVPDERLENVSRWTSVELFLLVVQRFGESTTLHGSLAENARLKRKRTLEACKNIHFKHWTL